MKRAVWIRYAQTQNKALKKYIRYIRAYVQFNHPTNILGELCKKKLVCIELITDKE